ncbi:MAG: hypothetical protein R3F61_07610 [Myxococcota bacterium]
MTTLMLLDDCVSRARCVPAVLDGHLSGPGDAALEYCDALLEDLDAALERCNHAVRCGADLDLVVSQVLQLKWLVYCALRRHLTAKGWSDTALAAFAYTAACDLRDSRDRVDAARSETRLARAG